MTKIQSRVRYFMNSVGQSTPDSPTIPDNLTRVLRVSLLLEEVLEFAEASGIEVSLRSDNKPIEIDDLNYNVVSEPDLVEILDSIGDTIYVALGAGISYGVQLEPVMTEICDSNDSKIEGGHKREDGKWMKSKSYRPVDLKSVLDKQLKGDFKGKY